jgi:DNA-binding HxlR family transcriptional regulator
MEAGGQPHQSDTKCMAAFKMIGDFWTLAIIYYLVDGEKRFGEIEKKTGSNSATLAARLKQLESYGLISRQTHTTDNQSVSYRLTPFGQEALPIVEQIRSFSERLEAGSPHL